MAEEEKDLTNETLVVRTGSLKIAGKKKGDDETKRELLREGDEFKTSEFGLNQEQTKQLLAAGTVETQKYRARRVDEEKKEEEEEEEGTKASSTPSKPVLGDTKTAPKK